MFGLHERGTAAFFDLGWIGLGWDTTRRWMDEEFEFGFGDNCLGTQYHPTSRQTDGQTDN